MNKIKQFGKWCYRVAPNVIKYTFKLFMMAVIAFIVYTDYMVHKSTFEMYVKERQRVIELERTLNKVDALLRLNLEERNEYFKKHKK